MDHKPKASQEAWEKYVLHLGEEMFITFRVL
jgi:hypothetical protein